MRSSCKETARRWGRHCRDFSIVCGESQFIPGKMGKGSVITAAGASPGGRREDRLEQSLDDLRSVRQMAREDWCAFADGHVELIGDEAQFRKLLGEAKAGPGEGL
jgi:hypothetical protein